MRRWLTSNNFLASRQSPPNQVRGSLRTFSFFRRNHDTRGESIGHRPVLSPGCSTLWTEGLSAVTTGACAGRAIDKGETETCLRVLCDPLTLFPQEKARSLNVFVFFSIWSPLLSSGPHCRQWRPRLPRLQMHIVARAISRSLAPRTASRNFPKPVTTPASTQHRRPENRFASPPRPIWPPLSTTPNAETRCFWPLEPLSM